MDKSTEINFDVPGMQTKDEVVERKGKGHPDTLTDAMAEELSCAYSNYTLKNFGYILHHDFDKVGIIGVRSQVKFGEGSLAKPITILINCRASYSFGKELIPVEQIINETVKKFIFSRYPTLMEGDVRIQLNLNPSSSPGNVESVKGSARKNWFSPRGPEDLPELTVLGANDSVIACGYAPLSVPERICLEVEQHLNSPQYKKGNPWCGTDIKLQVAGHGKQIGLTICVPQISLFVKDLDHYVLNVQKVKADIVDYVRHNISDKVKLELNLNTRDNYGIPELYLTAIGSSIESGDMGMVGRGNRINGLITPNRPMSIEAPFGKNPMYQVGKLYMVAAQRIAQRINEVSQSYVEIYILSQSGRPIKTPWKVIVKSRKTAELKSVASKIIAEELENIESITKQIIEGKIRLVI